MIGIVDYGAGNLCSVANALERLSKKHCRCARPADLNRVSAVVLPGVGQFASAARHLQRTGLFAALEKWGRQGNPLAGICLGLQLLFEESEEAPGICGLALLPGRTARLQARIVPHMGWNRVLASDVAWMRPFDGAYFYFAHSFAADPTCRNGVAGTTEVDGRPIAVAFDAGAIRAVQFHPEKSGYAGGRLMERILTW